MRLKVVLKTDVKDICIDYITVKLKSGKTVSLNWDTTEYTRDNGEYNACYKGVYFDEEYANGRIKELEGFSITQIGIHSEQEEIGTVTINELSFDDHFCNYYECYTPGYLLPYKVPADIIDRT